jgi:hypothetical protein
MNYFAKEKSSPHNSANASFVCYEKKICEEGKYVQNTTTSSITTLSIKILSIMGLFATISTNDIQHNDTECRHYFNVMLSVIMLNVIMLSVMVPKKTLASVQVRISYVI